MSRLPFFAPVQLALFLLLLALPGHSVTQTSASSASLLLQQANQSRLREGLKPVQNDPLLAQAALYHAFQMAQHDDISHDFAGEPDLSQRGATAGVRFSLITENVAEAPSAEEIHDLWMHSPDHRANLLDPEVNAVGIAVVEQRGATFAVEDFAATVTPLTLDEQEETVLRDLSSSGLAQLNSNAAVVSAARATCSMPTGYAGPQEPWYVMRYTAAHLDALPRQLQARLNSGQYHRMAVGACPARTAGSFTTYSVAILLYP